MKSIFWTFRNKNKIFVEKNKFYYIKNEKDYQKLINELLNYDAVSTSFKDSTYPNIKYPIILELQNGFAPSLEEVTKKDVINALKNNEKELNQWKKLLNI